MRQFIQARPAKHLAYAGDPWIVGEFVDRVSIVPNTHYFILIVPNQSFCELLVDDWIGVVIHGTELVHNESSGLPSFFSADGALS